MFMVDAYYAAMKYSVWCMNGVPLTYWYTDTEQHSAIARSWNSSSFTLAFVGFLLRQHTHRHTPNVQCVTTMHRMHLFCCFVVWCAVCSIISICISAYLVATVENSVSSIHFVAIFCCLLWSDDDFNIETGVAMQSHHNWRDNEISFKKIWLMMMMILNYRSHWLDIIGSYVRIWDLHLGFYGRV